MCSVITGYLEINAISIGLPTGGVMLSTLPFQWFHGKEVLGHSQTKFDFNRENRSDSQLLCCKLRVLQLQVYNI